ncbi:MAG: hypothetical protein A2928_03980 [Candidatus Taylorbacteria bacterium RIFCSPLOWO2_01_FULL_45_15b]|uniref:Uncharacterized protein n=1 Tax=Candidatus Taylorbacteria bacterium RIFCSPLOWO2_01_FULL_45_15b TaxID=1802319 RepID=A0A1G2NHU7_9BACT|nr:MAG: hypothetical protein A2928_03980 [Candidatus Taylorbacteria bacterium RIFCSPLOWO2_01_FULL_45_15b]
MSMRFDARRHIKILTDELPRELAGIRLQNLEYGLQRLYDNQFLNICRVSEGNYKLRLTMSGQKLSIIVEIPESLKAKKRST